MFYQRLLLSSGGKIVHFELLQELKIQYKYSIIQFGIVSIIVNTINLERYV